MFIILMHIHSAVLNLSYSVWPALYPVVLGGGWMDKGIFPLGLEDMVRIWLRRLLQFPHPPRCSQPCSTFPVP